MAKRTEADEFYGIFNDSFPPIIDGVTLTIQNYMDSFGTRNLSPCVVTPWNPINVPVQCKVLKYFSLPIHGRFPYRYGYPKLDPFIWNRLRTTPFRIVHSHSPFSSGRLAVYVKHKQGIPLVGTFHSKYRQDLEYSFRRTPWMVHIIMKRILNFFNACDEVWIPQPAVEETAREYGYKGKLIVVPNGNDMTPDSSEVEDIRRSARQALHISSDSISLLFVGQHIWQKGLKVVLDALVRLKERNVDFTMNFVGNGYAAPEMKRVVKSQGLSDRVHFHGVINDRKILQQFYAAADLFLFPSLYDNAPLVIREAAAYETPSLLAEGSTASEVIKNGDNGFLCAYDAGEYADAVIRLCADRASLRRAGQRAMKTFSHNWADVIDMVLDRYNTLIKLYDRHQAR